MSLKYSINHSKNILKKNHINDYVVFSKELLDHDGYDNCGPDSNLWTLYVITYKDAKYTIYKYYYEDWYENIDYSKLDLENDSFYQLQKIIHTSNIKDILYDINDIKEINDIINMINDIKDISDNSENNMSDLLLNLQKIKLG